MRILIVDDEERFARILCLALQASGYGEIDTAASGEEAVEKVRVKPCDILVTDLRMPGMNGLELSAEVKRRTPGTDVILMTAFADVETAREALKRGALDYLVKPFDNSELVALIAQAEARRNLKHMGEPRDESGVIFAGMVGVSPGMRKLFRSVEKAARHDSTVLILGESGTGKELVARAIHSLSSRHRGPFIDLHCAAIPEALLESELFGHEKGAFTGAVAQKRGRLEIAAGGTVFLDEIGEMPLALQPKLLRFLQEHRLTRVGGTESFNVDVRVVAATNRELGEEIKKGNFRQDLYYRLDVMRIEVPPLRERPGDVEPLVRHFLRTKGSAADAVSTKVLDILRLYEWPGNVRELENVIERAILEAEGEPVGVMHLPPGIAGKAEQDASEAPILAEGGLDLADNERQLIERALREADDNKSKAAKLLGITRRKLYSRMKLLGMDTGAE